MCLTHILFAQQHQPMPKVRPDSFVLVSELEQTIGCVYTFSLSNQEFGLFPESIEFNHQ